MANLKIFGSLCFPHVPSEVTRTKLELKSLKCVFVGIDLVKGAYKFFDPSTKKTYVSRDVDYEMRCMIGMISMNKPSSGMSQLLVYPKHHMKQKRRRCLLGKVDVTLL